jgi:uncharacterized protein involved in exopolysaccharide biosynthesis
MSLSSYFHDTSQREKKRVLCRPTRHGNIGQHHLNQARPPLGQCRTRLIDVKYTDTDPNRSTAIANAVVDAYMNQYTQARFQASSRAPSWLANQLDDLKIKVATSQANADHFQRDSGLTGVTISPATGKPGESQEAQAMPSSTDNVLVERLLELNRDLTNAEVLRVEKEAIYRMTETQDPDVVLGISSSTLVSDLGSNSPLSHGSSNLTLLQGLRQQQAQLTVNLAASNVSYGARNPAIIQLQRENAPSTFRFVRSWNGFAELQRMTWIWRRWQRQGFNSRLQRNRVAQS